MPRRGVTAHDPLTEHGAAMLEFLDERLPDHDLRVIVLLFGDKGGGIAMSGYEQDGSDGDLAAVTDLCVHLQAILQLHGKRLEVLDIADGGGS